MKNRRVIITSLIVIFFIAAAAGGWYYYNQYHKNNNPNQKNPITEADTNPENSNTQNNQTSNNSSQNQAVLAGSITITSLNQDSNGVYVGTIANGIKNGTCSVVFEKDNLSVVETAPLGLQVSYYTCKGFNPVVLSKFPQPGNYSVYVKINNDSREVRSSTQSVTIK